MAVDGRVKSTWSPPTELTPGVVLASSQNTQRSGTRSGVTKDHSAFKGHFVQNGLNFRLS